MSPSVDLSNASKNGHLQESLTTYTRPHVLVIDEVGYLTYGPDAANVLFHVVNDWHLRKRPMIFTTDKPLNEWGKVLHDEDMAAAILDRVLERGRFIHLDWPSREHMPCGAPGMTFKVTPLMILDESMAESPIGTIWSSSP